MDNLKYILIALVVLIVLYFASQMQQSGYSTRADAVFPEDTQAIKQIDLWTKDDTLTLKKEGEDWVITQHDTLQMRPNKMDPFFERVLGVKKETMMSRNPDNWAKYSIADTSGTHIKLIDGNGDEMAYAVFGRSSRDWTHNYVRSRGEDEVYLTNESVIHLMYPRASYWGEKPKADSTAADSASFDIGAIGETSMPVAETVPVEAQDGGEAAGPAVPEATAADSTE